MLKHTAVLLAVVAPAAAVAPVAVAVESGQE